MIGRKRAIFAVCICNYIRDLPGIRKIIGGRTVGGFYKPTFHRIPLTIVFGLKARFSLIGMEIASGSHRPVNGTLVPIREKQR